MTGLKKLLTCVWLACPMVVTAQSKNVTLTQHTTAATPASKTQTQTEEEPQPLSLRQRYTLPLFGELPKTPEQINTEITFLNDCDRNFGSRPEASTFFANRGWDYLAAAELDTAAHRFNLAWLLNNQNADAYWGLGVVSYQRDDLTTAIRMLEKGLAFADTNTVLMTDLATVQLKQFQTASDTTALVKAQQNLQKAITLKPADGAAYQKLAYASMLTKNYDQAWAYFHKARTLDVGSMDLDLVKALIALKPDPEGIFK